MGTSRVVVIHINPGQKNQIEHAQWLSKGLKRHNMIAQVTGNIYERGDIHIVSGPHWAKDHWVGHPRTVLLDCAYYHPGVSGKWKSMDWVSLGWMNAEGGRDFVAGTGREPPVPTTCKSDTGTIFLADYVGPVEKADTVRLHPSREKHDESLPDALSRHKTAVGYTTSALVMAGLMGLETVCKDDRNIMAQPDWLELLPYADWHNEEISSGEAWEHLQHTH